MANVKQKLNAARKELLDLGLRNKLINHGTPRASGLDIVDEKPAEVFGILVSKTSKMTFLHNPAADDPDREEDEVDFEQPDDETDEEGRATRHTDTKLQTPYSTSLLQRRLLNTYYMARTSIEEQGVNTLFLALGMLKWYEDDSSDKERTAPLVLVPVTLARANVESKFHIEYNGDEIGPNLSLKEKLKADFGIDMPLFEEVTEADLGDYFDSISNSIRRQSRWSVEEDAISLGFFAFAKFLMYRDLDAEGWEKGAEPFNHATIKSLLDEGFNGTAKLGDDAFLDNEVDPSQVHFVVDADSSQAQALMEIRGGEHQVIQGPPGTGKSQTITNIIADALGRGQKVLFVAEKMAALEVVKRRLSNIGIGEACLELHSNKTNKKEFLADLQHTLMLRKPVANNPDELLGDLIRARDKLNQYCDAVNTPIGESGVSPVLAFGKLLKMNDLLGEISDRPKVTVTDFSSWSGQQHRALVEVCRGIQALLLDCGTPSLHPFWGTGLRSCPPSLVEQITEQSALVLGQIQGYLESLCAAVADTKISEVDTKEERGVAHIVAKLLADSPLQAQVHINEDCWKDRREFENLLSEGSEQTSLLAELSSAFLAGTWEKDVTHHRGALVNYGEKWWRWLSGEYREAVKFARGHSKSSDKAPPEEILALYEKVLRFQELESKRDARNRFLSKASDRAIPTRREEWIQFSREASWAFDVRDKIEDSERRTALVTAALALSAKERKQRHEALLASASSLQDGLKTLSNLASMNEGSALGLDGKFSDLNSRLARWRAETSSVQQFVSLNHSLDELTKLKAAELVEVVTHWSGAAEFLVPLVEQSWHLSLVERAYKERQELAFFNGAKHEEIVRRFKEKDKELFDHNKRILALKHYEELPRGIGTGGQMALLQREFEKKRRHLPIRKLMIHSGNAIQAIKPVFMMSPLSIATYLPPGSTRFDLVIFDEASQVKPVDAFGALIRGEQAVVVGDSRQLPPTSFFDSNVDVEDDDLEETDVSTGDMESILSLFVAQGAPQKMLRWHYRSRHDSLIAISNMEFYDNRLFIFPSPYASVEELGLNYHYLPNTVYERGSKKSFNRGEAKAVAKAVMKHAKECPHLTLGVAAFSMKQMNTIIDELELLRRENPIYESFFSGHQDEPFFVKNLENVQGDERDVIFISVGYGKDENGYVAMNFGPLNRDGGERRLNVLITRAKQRCEIFTNLVAEDIDLNRTNAIGVRALKRYLRYAKDGVMDTPEITGQEADSDFELAVAEAIQRTGYEVDLQVGSAGFRIDIGVIDPRQKGRYILGVECDGATYHSARWARDRDRIRQAVLEGLGWKIHRVWSTDWFRSPESELAKILAAIEGAKATSSATPEEAPQNTFAIERSADDDATSLEPLIGKYQHADLRLRLDGCELHEVMTSQFADAIEAVVEVESPVHEEEVLRRIRESVGLGRAGSRIKGAFDMAVSYAKRKSLIRKSGSFLWKSPPEITEPRDRSEFSSQTLKLELIAPEEIQGAILFCVSHSHGISQEEIPNQTREVLGFKRTTQQMEEAIQAQVKKLFKGGKLEERGGYVFLVA